jgi:isopenicillin N synthase-like dioxygenase
VPAARQRTKLQQSATVNTELDMAEEMPESIPVLDLSLAGDPHSRPVLLKQLHAALFDVGFLYVVNHDIPTETIARLTSLLPDLFGLPANQKALLSKLNSPHFLGYSGFAEETTLGKQDLREQFDFATELPATWQGPVSREYNAISVSNTYDTDLLNEIKGKTSASRDFTQLYWRLRGPNQWPDKACLPDFRPALTEYHDQVEALSYQFVRLIEEAFGIPEGTFDHFFGREGRSPPEGRSAVPDDGHSYLMPQHRIKLLRYPPSPSGTAHGSQGVGAHKDSSGWLTFLYQVGDEEGLEVLSSSGEWIRARPIPNSFVVNFGNAFEAATEGAVKATIHRVISPGPNSNVRYSIPFFMGLPLDMTVSEIREHIPEHVRKLRSSANHGEVVSDFLDPRWDSLGESQLRKWLRSHKEVGERWYGKELVDYYSQ